MLPEMRVRHAATAFALYGSVAGICLAPPAYADSYDEEDEDTAGSEPDPAQAPSDTPNDERLSAGGLDTPGSFQAEDEKGDQVGRELEEADRRDSGRGLEFAWLVGDVGLGVVDAAGLDRGSLLAAGDASGGAGVSYGGGLGVRLLYFTLGARVAGADVGTLRTFGVGGELGMKLPLGNLEPLAVLDVGYVSASGLAGERTMGGLAGVEGLGLNLGLGADYYLSDYFSVGASLRLGLLLLGRPAQDPDAFTGTMDPIYEASGSGTGTNMALCLRIGFHL